MNRSESIKELANALCKAQAALHKAKKSSVNPHFKSKYANLEEVIDASREALTVNGLTVTQVPETDSEGKAKLSTLLMHTSGEFIESFILLPLTKPGPQDMGSCLTYLKRYVLAAMIGVADTDDDGEEAERAISNSKKVATPVASVTSAEVNLPPAKHAPRKYTISEKQAKLLAYRASTSGWSPMNMDNYIKANFNCTVPALDSKQFEVALAYLSGTPCTEELKIFYSEQNPKREPILESLEKAKKGKYVDHTMGPAFDDLEKIPF